MASNSVPVAVFYRSRQRGVDPLIQSETTPLLSGCTLLISGGMNMAMGLGWSANTEVLATRHLDFSWFIAASLGALLAAPLTDALPKRIYMGIGSLFVLAAGIIFVSVPYNYNATLAARYLNGLGVGFVTLAFLVYAGEISWNNTRGKSLAAEQYALCTGIAVQIIIDSQWIPGGFPEYRLHGILDIILVVLSWCFIYAVVDSPIFLLHKDNEAGALESLRRIQRSAVITDAMRTHLCALKAYVQQSRDLAWQQELRQLVLPLLKIMLHRSVLAFTLSIPLSFALIYGTYNSNVTNIWPPIVYAVLRFLGVLIGVVFVDLSGRKLVPSIALLCSGSMSLGIGIIFSNSTNMTDMQQMMAICILSFVAQFCAGLYAPATSAYLGEALPLQLKPFGIALCLTMENVVHIIVICTLRLSFVSVYQYCIATAVLIYISFVCFCTLMPETKRTSLAEAQKRFEQLANISFK